MNKALHKLVLAAAGMMLSLSSHAAPPPPLERLVDQLNSASYPEREEATEQIGSRDQSFTLKDVETQLRTRELTFEQRTRLLAASERIFMREPRAAIGLSWQIGNGAPIGRGITVGGCIEGFDAIRVLKPGDIVRAIDGNPVEDTGYGNNTDIRAEIVSRDPGDELKLSIVRNGEPMQVVCRVGKLTDLPDRRDFDIPMTAAWKKRAARMLALAPPPPTLKTTLLPQGWRNAEDEANKATRDQAEGYKQIATATGIDTRANDVTVVVPTARIGGEARGEVTPSGPDFDPDRGMRGRADGPQRRGGRGGMPRPRLN